MPIIGAAVIPHSPLLMPSLGGARRNLLATVIAGIDRVSELIQRLQPDTVVLIAPHESDHERFSGYVSEQLAIDLKLFGHLTQTPQYKNNYLPLFQLKKRMPKHLSLISSSVLGYSFGIPLMLLNKQDGQSAPTITAIQTCGKSFLEHVTFGSELREILETGNKTYMLVASADFSRFSLRSEPTEIQATYSDNLVLQTLRTRNIEQLLHPTEHESYLSEWVCGIRPLCVLLGALSGARYTSTIHTYDHSLGVGMIVATLDISYNPITSK